MQTDSHKDSCNLLRRFGLTSATALVISNMIGTGILTSSGFLASSLNSPALLLIMWGVGALLALLGSFCYSELAINFPRSGGEYVYLTEAYGPIWGFMSGWISFVAGFSAPIAMASLAFAEYLSPFASVFMLDKMTIAADSGYGTLRVEGAQICAILIILGFTVVNCIGIRRLAKIQNTLTAAKILVLLSLVVCGLIFGQGSWSHFSSPVQRMNSGFVPESIATSLFWLYLSYSGWNAATYVAEEITDARRTLPLALLIGTGIVATLYILLNIVFLYATPLESMKGVLAIGSFTAKRLFGPGIGAVYCLLFAVSLLSTINAGIMTGPRVYHEMAKKRAFPAMAAKISSRWHTPIAAILAQGICAVVMVLIPFRNLLLYVGFLLNFFTVLAVGALFIFRQRQDWIRLPVVSFLWPSVPLLFIAIGACMTAYGIYLEWKVCLAALLTICLGAVFYHIRLRNFDHSPLSGKPGRRLNPALVSGDR